MPGYRSREETLQYRRSVKNDPPSSVCFFCNPDPSRLKPVSQGQFFQVVKSDFPYSLWDGMKVADHLMLLPRAHTDTIKGLSPEAAVEYTTTLGEYESRGYSNFTRAPGSIAKSVDHHHTHLVKTVGARKKLLMHSSKPYIRVSL